MFTKTTLLSFSAAAFALSLTLPSAAQGIPGVSTTPVTSAAPVTKAAPTVPPIPITQNPPGTQTLPAGQVALPAAGSPEAITPLPTPGLPLSVPASYKLGIDDVVSVLITGFPEQSMPQVAVGPDGTITLPLLDAVQVVGQTPAQLQAHLTKAYRKYIVRPLISVSLLRKRPQFVTFSGYVARAGQAEYRPGQRIIEALAATGGIPTTGNAAAITVQHSNGQTQTLDLTHPETKAESQENIVLQSGDIVFVPEQRSQIIVAGFVPKPGPIPYKEDMKVQDALAVSGAPSAEAADLANATVTHDGREYPVNLYALLYQNDQKNNIKLGPGDVLNVPELVNKVFVFGGGVAHEGYYAFKPGDRLLDAIKATIPAPGADLAKVTFSHLDKQANQVTGTMLDVQKFINGKEKSEDKRVALNPPLKIGDIIYVPVKGPGGGFLKELAPLSAIAGLASSTTYLLGR